MQTNTATVSKWATRNLGSTLQMLRAFSMVLVLLVMCLVLTLMSPSFLTQGNLFNVIRQVSIVAIVAVGMTMVIITGGIDLSVGSMVAVTGALAASTLRFGTGVGVYMMNPPENAAYTAAAIIVALLIGSIIGFLNGFLITKGGLEPFIVTLGTMALLRGLALVYMQGQPIVGMTPSFSFIGKGYLGPIPFPVILLVGVVLFFHFVLSNTTFGRKVYAVGGNQEAARLSGINIDRVKIGAYTLTGLLCGLAGVILASRLNSAETSAGSLYELDAIAAAVIGGTAFTGGRGNVLGTVIGALILGVVSNGMNLMNVPPFYEQVVKGAIIIIAVWLGTRSKGRH